MGKQASICYATAVAKIILQTTDVTGHVVFYMYLFFNFQWKC